MFQKDILELLKEFIETVFQFLKYNFKLWGEWPGSSSRYIENRKVPATNPN